LLGHFFSTISRNCLATSGAVSFYKFIDLECKTCG
jgi:hypothetical protein